MPDAAVDLKRGEAVQLQFSTEALRAEKTPMQLLVEKWSKEPLEGSAPVPRPTLGKLMEQFTSDPTSPTDAAAQHDHYLYGTPKRENP